MRTETAKRVHDAVSACDEITQFTAHWSRYEFLRTRGPQLIVWKLVELAGEALRQGADADPPLRTAVPEMEGARLMDSRIFHYDTVDFGVLWDIAIDEVPPLRERLTQLLASAPPPVAPETRNT